MRKPVLALLGGLSIAALIAVALGLVALDRREEAAVRPPATPASVASPAAAASVAVTTASAASATPLLPPQQPSRPQPPAPASSAAATAPPASGPVRSSFALSSEHQSLVQEALLAAADLRQLEREERDNDWAPETERRIRAELSAHPSFGNFEIVAIECRQSLCAIQAFSYGEDGNSKWVTALDELYQQSLAQLFDSVSTAFPTEAKRAAVLSFLHRKPGAGKP